MVKLRIPPHDWTYETQPGERAALFDGKLIVTHPDRQAKIVYPDGSEEIITFTLVEPGPTSHS